MYNTQYISAVVIAYVGQTIFFRQILFLANTIYDWLFYVAFTV